MSHAKRINADEVKHRLDTYLGSTPVQPEVGSARIISTLENAFKNLVVFGGTVRDLALSDSDFEPADIDIVVHADTEELKRVLRWANCSKTRFGGLRFHYYGRLYDVWSLQSTWAFSEGLVKGGESYQDLLRTTFFNVDAAFFSFPDRTLHTTENYFSALHKRVLDINLEENPNPGGMALRALRMARFRKFGLAPRLINYVLRHFPQACRAMPYNELAKIKEQVHSHLENSPGKVFRYSNEITQYRAKKRAPASSNKMFLHSFL